MEPGFWIARWREGRIGFHREFPQPWLVEHAAAFLEGDPERVLVPLCGKSVDLAWLEARGLRVVGVEIARTAVEAFLAEAKREFTVRSEPPFTVFETGRIELWQGDFFALDRGRHGDFPAIFDRAALIALPPALRRGYAEKLLELLRAGGRLLLVGLEYDQERMPGPPFAVWRDEARELFAGACDVIELGTRSMAEVEPLWAEKGIAEVREYGWLLRRRPS